jgi:hypothetical protein
MSAHTSLNLHLDDIHEQCRSKDVKDCAESSNIGTAKYKIQSSSTSFYSKTKEHIKLFKQYVSTCQNHGVNCSLDPESSSNDSDSDEDHPRRIHRRSSASHRPLVRLGSFLTRPRSSSFTGPHCSDNGRSNESASRTPSQSSAPSRTESPAMSWRSPSSSLSRLPQLGSRLADTPKWPDA